MRATWMAWEAAGRPARADATSVPGRCLVCRADTDTTVPAKTALGANFDYATAKGRGDSVCVPCTWALAGKPPQTFRLWSIAVTDSVTLPPSMPGAPYPSDGRLHLCNRRDMSVIVGVLTDPPACGWAVAVAQSGQKHLLPYTPVNHGTGAWRARWESTDVTSTPDVFAALLGAVAALRVAGHHPTNIARGEPSVTALKGDGLTEWRRHHHTIRPHAGSPLLDLALHCTTKENINDLAVRFA